MYYYDDYYDEPNEFEEKIEEFKGVLVKAVKKEHQEEIARLREENQKLLSTQDEMKKAKQEYESKKRDYEYKIKDAMENAKKEYFNTNIKDVVESVTEKQILYYARQGSKYVPKCNLCDDDRKLTATFANGKTTSMSCQCNRTDDIYRPEKAEIVTLTIGRYKKKSYDRYSSIYARYKPSYHGADDSDYDYKEFSICFIADIFSDEVKTAKFRYGERVGFTSLVECQKYCDWLNISKDVTAND